MSTPEEKYLNDPQYNMCVDKMKQLMRDCQFTPSEMREMVVLACTHHEMKTVRPMFYRTREGQCLE